MGMSQSSKPIPIAISNDLLAKIEYAAEKLGWTKQDTMREAMKLGLKFYERIGWDTTGAILDAATKRPDEQTLRFPVKPEVPSRLNEEPIKYGSKK